MGFGTSKQKSQNQSQQTSESRNQAFPFIQSTFAGQAANAGTGATAIANLLGLNGASGQNEGFERFKNSSGYNFIQDQGIRGVTASKAAKGLLSSGSLLTGLSDYSSNLANNFLNSYMAQMMGLSNSGLQAGQLIASAGNTANSQGTSFGSSKGSSFNATMG